ncbi:MAG: hypothetical protein ABF490_04715 [Lentilactobacillus hilgardii]|uniref:hypothetical protein n=1 Tax=Lentilactobacillus hilgardii TaxID=1588 RepID=UPI001CC1CBBD|nr:hypothetical protein [Lentilactobacillus hilgardii]MBZ2200530.1 hypothetical protein [Lentilactobacillus hilgardii]MBZ2204594.1 hypothetical protein [Lentilactobacillus hilgardii]
MDKLRHLDKNKILQFSQFKMLPAEVFNRQLKRGDQLLLGNEHYRVAGLIYKQQKFERQLYKYLLEKVPDSRI